MTDIVGHFLIFSIVSVVGLMIPLLLGALIRPTGAPSAEKDAVYECGEPTIGSSYVQFDLRFYVVALLFIIFDVELVFFFPWVLAFGGATQLADTRLSDIERSTLSERLVGEPGMMISSEAALQLSWVAFFDVLFFFAVLLVGFAYVWKRGDLDWVRAVTKKTKFSRPARPVAAAAVAPNPVIAG
ncbi:MAG: NADH-quinone oxidoreductase subunit A [Planctomycetaceae bacterium]|nr:NADH-quinone oxidoreductase subunit A [Planctomycetaceae bacterium]